MCDEPLGCRCAAIRSIAIEAPSLPQGRPCKLEKNITRASTNACDGLNLGMLWGPYSYVGSRTKSIECFAFLLQVFYQGIDKVSRVIETPFSPDDPPDDAEREEKGADGEDIAGAGGGDGATEPAEDSPAKEDDEQAENGDGENREMTDEELAARCADVFVLYRGFIRLCSLFCPVRSKLLNRYLILARGPRSKLWNMLRFLSKLVLR